MGDHPHFGEIIGRYGNRIGNGTINIAGKEYQLSKNHGEHTLHGGFKGFGQYLWQAEEIKTEKSIGVELRRTSPHLEEGFPGNLDVVVRYEIDRNNALSISYEAVTDQATFVNLTNHSYFNLNGAANGNILDHILTIHSKRITSSDDDLIPNGRYTDLAGTPLDFRNPTKIGTRIYDQHPLLIQGKGYDHNYVLDLDGQLEHVATVYEEKSGRVMEVLTEEPGVQLYTSNWLDGSLVGKEGIAYQKHAAFCLETQHFPDSPHHAHFPSTLLNPGDLYQTNTIYRFSIRT
jgi:aldose 1-epimerase